MNATSFLGTLLPRQFEVLYGIFFAFALQDFYDHFFLDRISFLKFANIFFCKTCRNFKSENVFSSAITEERYVYRPFLALNQFV